MLSCKEVVQVVTDYLEDALPAAERLRFERHIAICPPCRGYLAQMRKTLQVSGQVTEESLAPETRAALLQAFQDWKHSG